MNSTNLAKAGKFYTVEEYLAIERESEEKHEYVDGAIIALESENAIVGMAGASRTHNLITANAGTEIRFQLKGKNCETYIADMRVRMRNPRYGYPDVTVVCGAPQFEDDEFDTLLNPTLVIEVSSKSTRFRDKTEKLEPYLQMESVQDCILIEQDKMRVELYKKTNAKAMVIRNR